MRCRRSRDRPADVLGVASLVAEGPTGHHLSNLHAGHALADRVDQACDVLARREGWLRVAGQSDRPNQEFEPRHAGSDHLDSNLADTRLREALLDQLQDLRSAALGDHDAMVHGSGEPDSLSAVDEGPVDEGTVDEGGAVDSVAESDSIISTIGVMPDLST